MGLSMGGKYPCRMTIWDVKPYEKSTSINMTSSRKGQDGNWVKDFGCYCRFIGEAHKKAKVLKERDTITPKNIDVSVLYNKEKGCNDVNIIIWDFALIDKEGNITEVTEEMIKNPATSGVKVSDDGFMVIPEGIENALPFK